MKRLLTIGILLGALSACDEAAMNAATAGSGSGTREFLVIGGRMTFDQCKARNGLIIQDQGSAMIACDPSVRRTPAAADEFDHPTNNAAPT